MTERMQWETIQVSNRLPSGSYAKIRVYDNGGKTIDRYTVVYPERSASKGLYQWARSEGVRV